MAMIDTKLLEFYHEGDGQKRWSLDTEKIA